MKHAPFSVLSLYNLINPPCPFLPVPPVPANIEKVSEDITVNEGSNVTLSCLASGRPEPSITWRLLNPSGKSHQVSAFASQDV